MEAGLSPDRWTAFADQFYSIDKTVVKERPKVKPVIRDFIKNNVGGERKWSMIGIVTKCIEEVQVIYEKFDHYKTFLENEIEYVENFIANVASYEDKSSPEPEPMSVIRITSPNGNLITRIVVFKGTVNAETYMKMYIKCCLLGETSTSNGYTYHDYRGKHVIEPTKPFLEWEAKEYVFLTTSKLSDILLEDKRNELVDIIDRLQIVLTEITQTLDLKTDLEKVPDPIYATTSNFNKESFDDDFY